MSGGSECNGKIIRQSEGEESAEADGGRGAMTAGWLGKNPPMCNI